MYNSAIHSDIRAVKSLSNFSVYFGIYIVQRQNEEKLAITVAKLKHFMIMDLSIPVIA